MITTGPAANILSDLYLSQARKCDSWWKFRLLSQDEHKEVKRILFFAFIERIFLLYFNDEIKAYLTELNKSEYKKEQTAIIYWSDVSGPLKIYLHSYHTFKVQSPFYPEKYLTNHIF
jgi:hypothetical protein